MKYLTVQDILVIHAKIIEATSGAHGVRDINLLMSLAERPKTTVFGEEMYKNLFQKAAVYMESLARYHVFTDGNKRTALGATDRFLFLNGCEFSPSNKEAEEFVLDVVVKKLDIPTIANWLKTHSKNLAA